MSQKVILSEEDHERTTECVLLNALSLCEPGDDVPRLAAETQTTTHAQVMNETG